MQDIVVGRSRKDVQKYGLDGAIFLGRHYVRMGQDQSLSNNVYMDVAGAHVMFICGKRGGGKCLTGDTRIALADGREVPIKDLNNLDQDIIALNNDLKIVSAPKSAFYKRTVNKILQVTLRSGKTLKLTPEHPLRTLSGWQPAQHLAIGSRIACPRHVSGFGEQVMPEHEIKILAYLLTEGHVSNGFVLFTNADSSIVSDFTSAIARFDSNLELEPHGEITYRVVSIAAKRKIVSDVRSENGRFESGIMFDKKTSLVRYLTNLNIYGMLAAQREIPQQIFMLPKHQLSLFLNRMFGCDGTIYCESNSRWRISYSSASITMIEQVQSLLLKFGILSSFRKKIAKDVFISYELEVHAQHIHSFLQEIGFFGKKLAHQKKALRCSVRHNPCIDTIPKELWETFRPSNWSDVGRAAGYKNPKSFRSSINYAPSREKLQLLALADGSEYAQQLATSDIFWDEITDIASITTPTEVYDITVPEFHNFVANGVIVHNSYTMGAIAEGFHLLNEAVKQNLSVILLDTMGVYWTMKYPNKADRELLEEWGLEPQEIPLKIFTPTAFFNEYKKKGIPTDAPFSLAPSLIDPDDWCTAFRVEKYSPEGILISNTVLSLKKTEKEYTLQDMQNAIAKDADANDETKNAVASMFRLAQSWGVFTDTKGEGNEATKLSDIAKGGQITVLDVSCYATMPGGWDVKSLIVGLLGQRLFVERMLSRKDEEFENVESTMNVFSQDKKEHQDMPLVWLVLDEAHEFLPKEGKVASSDPLITIMREGRQPGLSLMLATQQPGKIHTDVMTQSDIVLSHRITAKIDVDALGMLMQSYMREGLVEQLDHLPREKGAGILFDDQNEKMYPIRVRPRFTWHGGSSPFAVPDKKKEDDFL